MKGRESVLSCPGFEGTINCPRHPADMYLCFDKDPAAGEVYWVHFSRAKEVRFEQESTAVGNPPARQVPRRPRPGNPDPAGVLDAPRIKVTVVLDDGTQLSGTLPREQAIYGYDEEGYHVRCDLSQGPAEVEAMQRLERLAPRKKVLWGGRCALFKSIRFTRFVAFSGGIDKARREAERANRIELTTVDHQAGKDDMVSLWRWVTMKNLFEVAGIKDASGPEEFRSIDLKLFRERYAKDYKVLTRAAASKLWEENRDPGAAWTMAAGNATRDIVGSYVYTHDVGSTGMWSMPGPKGVTFVGFGGGRDVRDCTSLEHCKSVEYAGPGEKGFLQVRITGNPLDSNDVMTLTVPSTGLEPNFLFLAKQPYGFLGIAAGPDRTIRFSRKEKAAAPDRP